jgi:Cytochrome c
MSSRCRVDSNYRFGTLAFRPTAGRIRFEIIWRHFLVAQGRDAEVVAFSPPRSDIVVQDHCAPIRNLGAYLASLTPPKLPALFRKGAEAAVGRRCASCHTDTYAGTKAVARLAGQREDCLLKALHDYKSGARSGGGMAAMAEVAYPLSEEEITALAHYLANL